MGCGCGCRLWAFEGPGASVGSASPGHIDGAGPLVGEGKIIFDEVCPYLPVESQIRVDTPCIAERKNIIAEQVKRGAVCFSFGRETEQTTVQVLDVVM
jgi:hypothetical protein